MDKLALATASAAAMWKNDLTAHALGMTLGPVTPGKATLSMPVRPDMCNGHRICHGGMIFTLADTAFAYACNSHNRVTVANNCTITFVAPANAGDNLTAVAEERHRGGRSGVCDVTVTDQTGKLVAVFRGHSTELKGTLIETSPPPPPFDSRPLRGRGSGARGRENYCTSPSAFIASCTLGRAATRAM